MKRLYTILVCSLALTLTACAGDDTVNSGPTEPEPDMQTESDAGTDPDVRGAPDVRVGPFPRFIGINMEPGRAVYSLGTALLANVTVFDLEGEPADGLTYVVTPEPASAATQNDAGRWVLEEEGAVTFTACAEKPGFEGEEVCASDTVIVDDSSPTIEVTKPAPGAELDAAAMGMIEVAGTVTDTNGTPALFINGVPVELTNDGSFESTVAPRFGINHIEFAASDGVNPATTETAVDVMWANDYEAVPDTGRPELDQPNGLILWLGQRFVDDGVPPGSAMDGSRLTKDLADIIELVLLNIDFLSQITNPVVDSSNFTLNVTGVDIGKPTVIADITDNGIEMYIQIKDLMVTTDGGLSIEGQNLDLDGDVTATFSALASLDISKSSPSDPVEVQVGQLALAVEEADANFASAEANAIFELAQSALRNTIESLLISTIEEAFVNQLPVLISDLLNGLDEVLADQTLDLDIGLGTPVTVNLDGGISTLETVFRNRIQADLDLAAYVDVMPAWPASRGIALLEPMPVGTPFFESSRIQLAVKTSFVNGLMHTLWNAGLLELDVTEQLPIAADEALISAKLPPLIRPPLEGQTDDFVVQIGQLELTLTLAGRTETHGINIETGIDFIFMDNNLAVTFADTPTFRTWLISSSEPKPLLSAEALESLLASQVYPQLLSALTDGLAIPLPIPDLSGLGNVAAPLANFELTLGSIRPVAVREGYIVLDAELNGRLP